MLDLEPEENWLRHRLRRLRTILRYAKEPRVESGLREYCRRPGIRRQRLIIHQH